MASFPCLEGLAVAANSMVNEHRLLIAELNVFGGPLALQCAEFLTQLSQTEVLKMLEIRKSIAKIPMIPVSQITKVDPPVGLFVNHIRSLFESDFVPLDPRLRSKKSAMDRSLSRGSTEEADNVKISQSCNGLLLCGGSGMPRQANGASAGTVLTTSVLIILIMQYIGMEELHWLRTENRLIILMAYTGSTADTHTMSYFVNLGMEYCLCGVGFCFVCLDDFGSSDFTIYEMMIVCSVWTVRYRVHTDDFMTPIPEGWSIRSNVWSIILGEREQDSFLVMLSGKVVQYNLISKTLYEIYDCGSNQLDDNHDDNDDDELFQQFQAEHNVYEFIPSFASV
ncbi:hypothetical protein Tco_0627360 [Tanacetum coccineum]|uniref:Uncharacterized protein n=1 Tax=Tanacetum coccineum TaxID=301880 RepID=A0ABQ4WMA2_9ASTR